MVVKKIMVILSNRYIIIVVYIVEYYVEQYGRIKPMFGQAPWYHYTAVFKMYNRIMLKTSTESFVRFPPPPYVFIIPCLKQLAREPGRLGPSVRHQTCKRSVPRATLPSVWVYACVCVCVPTRRVLAQNFRSVSDLRPAHRNPRSHFRTRLRRISGPRHGRR